MNGAPLPKEIGRYRVARLLGHGAMGRVLLAHDPVLGREVAIKLLRRDLALAPGQEATLLDRMRQEARASARVLHPNIVALFDMGEDPELGLYLVFEYVEGPTLKKRIDEAPLRPAQVAKIARELGHALSTAHDAGVLHRDIKPENVILSKSGAKIADFGIARIPGSTLTRDGGILGTPAYSSPEGIETGKFTPASDQFSLAATLYEALSGKRAFPGDDAVTVANRISTLDPAPIAAGAGLDPHVDGVLARGMAKAPDARFGSAEQFGNALAEALGLSSARAAMPTVPDVEPVPAEPRPYRALAVLAGVALGFVLALSYFKLSADEVPPPPAAPSAADGESVEPPPRPRPVKPRARPSAAAPPVASAPSADAAADAASPPTDAAAD